MTDFKNIPSQFDDIPDGHPVVFISYSWDSDEHKAWVKKLSDDLRSKYAVYTLLDRYNRGGFDLITFMTKAVELADRVLLIGTPDYRRKSDEYDGGDAYSEFFAQARMGKNNWEPLKQGLFDGSYSNFVDIYNRAETFYQGNRR